MDIHKKRERNPSITLKNSTKPQRKKQTNKQKKNKRRITKKRKPINKMAIMIRTYLLIVTLNVRGLNAPVKKTQGS